MLEARVSDSYVMPGFGDWMPGDVTTVYDPVSHHVINEFEFPVFPGRISYDLMCMGSNELGDFRQLNDNTLIIPYGNITGIGGDVHDTFNYDSLGNIYNGHTTIRIPGGFDSHHEW